MKNTSLIKFAALLASLALPFFATSAAAQTAIPPYWYGNTWVCNACGAGLDGNFRAIHPIDGDFYAVDYLNAEVLHYQVSGGNITPLPVDPGTQAYVTDVQQAYYESYNTTGTGALYVQAYTNDDGTIAIGPKNGSWPVAPNSIRRNLNIPSQTILKPITPQDVAPGQTDDGYVNAYDTVTNASAQQQVINNLNTSVNYWAGNPQYIANRLYNSIAIVLSAFTTSKFTLPAFTLHITVTFHDGSTRQFMFDGNQNSYLPVTGTAYDSEGNLIIENARMAAGVPPKTSNTYVYTQGDYNFLNFLHTIYNYGLVSSGTVITPGTVVTCTLKGEGQEVCQ